VVLTSQNIGRHHERSLRAGFHRSNEAEQSHDGLARPDIALQKPQHALGRGHVLQHLVDGARLRTGQGVGQGGKQFGALCPVAGNSPPGGPFQVPPREGKRQLVGQQLVIGEPLAGRRLGPEVRRAVGAVDAGQRNSNRWPGAPRQQSRIVPLGEPGQAVEGSLDAADEEARRQIGSQRIDRLGQRQAGELLWRNDVVGMHHLRQAAIPLDAARYEALRALGEDSSEIVAAGMKEHQQQRAGVVVALDPIGAALPASARRPVAADRHLDCHDAVLRQSRKLGTGTSVDDAGGQVKQKVDDTGFGVSALALTPDEPRQALLNLRTDAAQGRGASEQRIEQGRAHQWPRPSICGKRPPPPSWGRVGVGGATGESVAAASRLPPPRRSTLGQRGAKKSTRCGYQA
jgi:hypothetical protein